MCWRTFFKDTFLLVPPGSRDWLQNGRKCTQHTDVAYFVYVTDTMCMCLCVCAYLYVHVHS